MRIVNKQKGFTLVELAIVLVIVGLLIGGILKGQQMLQNSRITATVAELNGFEAATTNFRDAYGELPGDLLNPETRIPSCTACFFDKTANTLGNNRVGYVDWDYVYVQTIPLKAKGKSSSNAYKDSNCALSTGTCDATFAETVLFWYELQQAGLMSAVTDEGINDSSMTTSTMTFGGTMPSAIVGGGFWVGNSSGTGPNDSNMGRSSASTSTFDILGTILVVVAKPDQSPSNLAGIQAFTPAVAAAIDRKYDDGAPDSGLVHAYGVPTSCYSGTNNNIYAEGIESKDCGLIIRIQK